MSSALSSHHLAGPSNTQSNTSSPRTPLTTGSASVTKILGVGEDTTVAVIGTLYKDMALKPSILDEYSKDPGVRAALGAADLCSDGDGLVLEDEGARMALRGSSAGVLEPHAFVTGRPVLGGVRWCWVVLGGVGWCWVWCGVVLGDVT